MLVVVLSRNVITDVGEFQCNQRFLRISSCHTQRITSTWHWHTHLAYRLQHLACVRTKLVSWGTNSFFIESFNLSRPICYSSVRRKTKNRVGGKALRTCVIRLLTVRQSVNELLMQSLGLARCQCSVRKTLVDKNISNFQKYGIIHLVLIVCHVTTLVRHELADSYAIGQWIQIAVKMWFIDVKQFLCF